MASRGGPRAAGSDGSDFTHREQVATRYHASTALKSKVKICSYLNLVFCLPEAAFILNGHAGLVQLPASVRPDLAHYLLLLTAAFSLLHLAALPRNRRPPAQLASLGLLVCGLGGAGRGLAVYGPRLAAVAATAAGFDALGRPEVFAAAVCCLLFLTRAVLHVQILHYVRRLLATWDTATRRTNKAD